MNTFQNLNKLEALDLSFNSLVSIENNLFYGLNHLKDLYLWQVKGFDLVGQSFGYLTAISNIYVNETVVIKHKCVFMHSITRLIQRNVADKLIFFKSFNLITQEYSSILTRYDLKCMLLQFKVHLNLKTDQDYEISLRNARRF